MTSINHSAWQDELSRVITNVPDLLKMLDITFDAGDLIFNKKQLKFPIRVPREFTARMEKGNIQDPLLLQVLFQTIEMQHIPNFCADPLNEKNHNPMPGLLQKYPNRVLLTLTSGCAIHCRYCFRRHFPYKENVLSDDHWLRILSYLTEHSMIDEVILSGGDPLILKDHLLAEYVKSLESIAQLKRLRIHTRLPIVIPSRVTSAWIEWMQKTRFHVVVVFHVNHPNEIDASVIESIQKLRKISITLLNQSVLLKGVNDNANILAALSHRLFDAGILPYYLHLLDKIQGAAHFEVNEKKANQIMVQLKEQLPGYLVPKLAREVTGQLSKQF